MGTQELRRNFYMLNLGEIDISNYYYPHAGYLRNIYYVVSVFSHLLLFSYSPSKFRV